jgi:hypothetical protein
MEHKKLLIHLGCITTPLIPVKKLQHKDISHLFFSGETVVGTKIMMLAACNSQNKLHEKCPLGI